MLPSLTALECFPWVTTRSLALLTSLWPRESGCLLSTLGSLPCFSSSLTAYFEEAASPWACQRRPNIRAVFRAKTLVSQRQSHLQGHEEQSGGVGGSRAPQPWQARKSPSPWSVIGSCSLCWGGNSSLLIPQNSSVPLSSQIFQVFSKTRLSTSRVLGNSRPTPSKFAGGTSCQNVLCPAVRLSYQNTPCT